MNNSFTARMKAFLPSLSVLCLLFLITLGKAQATTTVFSTDSSWRVTNTFLPSWNLPPYVLTPAWLVPGGGKIDCNQVGVVGANKIWYPSNAAYQTSYFRKKFSIPNTCELKNVTIDIAADDNYVVYINGITLGTGGATAKTFSIPITLLKCDNVIAVQARDLNKNCWWMAAKITINTTPITISASSNSPVTNSICVGQTLNLFAGSLAGATYSWIGPGGFTSNSQNPVKPNVSLADSGIYTVIINVGKCCRFVSTVHVGVKNCTDCLDLFSKEVFCKNGLYYLTVCIKNNSSHVANSINLISSTAGVSYTPNILSPSGGLLPGQTYCTTVQISGSGATNGALVCLKAMLLEIKNCQPVWFCTSKEDLCVTLPNCQIPPPCNWTAVVKDSILTICRGTSATLLASTSPVVAATYLWTSSPTSTIVNGNTAMPTVTPSSSPTVYTVTISSINPDGTICKKKATVTVFLKDCPSIPCDSVKVSFNPNNVTICLGDSVQLNPITNPTTGLTYLWIPSTGLSSATIKNPWAKPTVTTTYNLIVSVPGTNCKKDASMTVTVKQCNPNTLCDWRAAVKDTVLYICKGTSATLLASTIPAVGGASYVWTSSPASTIVGGNTPNPTVTPSASPTIYTVTITTGSTTTGQLCVKTATVKVFWKDCTPVVNCDSLSVGFSSANINLCLGDSVQLNPITNPVSGLSYEWIPPTGLSNAAIKNPWAKPTVTTTYFVVAGIPSTNCKKKTSITVTVNQCPLVPNSQRKASQEEAMNDIIIAPNPTHSIISVQIPDSMNWEKATLINAQGIILNEQERVNEAKIIKFDVQTQPSGMYIIRVKTDKGFVNKKVMKE